MAKFAYISFRHQTIQPGYTTRKKKKETFIDFFLHITDCPTAMRYSNKSKLCKASSVLNYIFIFLYIQYMLYISVVIWTIDEKYYQNWLFLWVFVGKVVRIYDTLILITSHGELEISYTSSAVPIKCYRWFL